MYENVLALETPAACVMATPFHVAPVAVIFPPSPFTVAMRIPLAPVVNVNWDDAQAYVSWLSGKAHHEYRLLSESEYEYAERAGSTTMFWWGDEAAPVCLYANYHECASGPARAGAYRPNAFGLDDMTGNTFEWVEDCWHPDYHGAPSDGAAWTSSGCSSRVMRGTPWFVTDPTPLRSSRRDTSDSGNRSDVIGFRVARNL